jgi:hypothetical protein
MLLKKLVISQFSRGFSQIWLQEFFLKKKKILGILLHLGDRATRNPLANYGDFFLKRRKLEIYVC